MSCNFSDTLHIVGTLNLSPGVPVPNADFLYRMIMTKVFESGSSVDGSYIVDFLLGKAKARDPNIPQIKVLDYPTFRKVIKLAKRRHLNKTLSLLSEKLKEKNKDYKYKRTGKQKLPANKTRRYNIYDDDYHVNRIIRLGGIPTWPPEGESYLRIQQSYTYVLKFMGLMQQSVYQTQYNLKKTKFYRKKFQNDLNYKFALLYGMMLESKDKLDTLLNVMRTMSRAYDWGDHSTRFVYYLSSYEKALAAVTDINYLAGHMRQMREGVRASVKKAKIKLIPQKNTNVRRRN